MARDFHRHKYMISNISPCFCVEWLRCEAGRWGEADLQSVHCGAFYSLYSGWKEPQSQVKIYCQLVDMFMIEHFPWTFLQDPHLNRFFQQCQKREADLSQPPTSNFLNCLKVSVSRALTRVWTWVKNCAMVTPKYINLWSRDWHLAAGLQAL